MIYKFFSLISNLSTLNIFIGVQLVILIYLTLIIFLTTKYSKIIKRSKNEENVRHSIFILLFISHFSYKSIEWFNGGFSMPLSIGSISVILSLLLLITKRKGIFDIVIFTGIFGALLNLLIPLNGYIGFDNIRFYTFIFDHTMILVIPLYFKFGYGYNVTINSFMKSNMFLIILWLINFFVNTTTRTFTTLNTNYMYTHELPLALKGIFPGWPIHILIFWFITFTVFCTTYIIFKNKKNTNTKHDSIKIELE